MSKKKVDPELESREHVPHGPVRIASTDDLAAAIVELDRRIAILKSQVQSIIIAVAACERRQMPLVQGDDDAPIDLRVLADRISKLEGIARIDAYR